MKTMLLSAFFAIILSPLSSCSDDEAALDESVTPASSEMPAAPAAPAATTEVDPTTDSQANANSGSEDNLAAGIAYVATEALNVRSGPGVSHPVVDTLIYRKKVSILKSGPWTQIGSNQFVYSKYLSSSEPQSPIANPILNKE